MNSEIDDYSLEHFQVLCQYLATTKEHGLVAMSPKLPKKIYQVLKVWSYIEKHADLEKVFQELMNIIHTCIIQTQHNKFHPFNYVLKEY